MKRPDAISEGISDFPAIKSGVSLKPDAGEAAEPGLREFPRDQKRGLIEAGSGIQRGYGYKKGFPRDQKRGLIEASWWCVIEIRRLPFPRDQKRGLIEASCRRLKPSEML